MANPTVGSQVSHYRLERVLGAGGMGQVFLARDLTLDRPVAIKFLLDVGDEHARRRLLAEARSSAALDHPSICTVHEVVTDEVRGDFIVMQYVEGETLAHRLKRGRLPLTEALSITTALLQALSTAHRAGVIHRDIKPQNIIITASGQPKLLDFGIAKRLVHAPSSEDATTVAQLTGADDVVGTLAYMSPEQVQGRPVDARSDLFSLGSVLYECLTGRRAFAGASKAETIGLLLHVDPPLPSTVASELVACDALCADLLKKSATERFQSADEVLGAIRGLSPTHRLSEVTERVSTGTVPVVRSASRWKWEVAAVLVIAAVGVGTWVWRSGSALPVAAPDAVRRFDQGVDKLREGSYVGARSAFEEAVRISPDYVQARYRLAEAKAELDDSAGAKEELVRVSALLPSLSRLPIEDQLRLEAVRSSVLREPDKAISAYRQLADRRPEESSGWLDVGRAEDAAGQRVNAQEHFALAVKLDSQSAAAHLRLGILQSQGGEGERGLASIEEAIRLHKISANVEGEGEATLRKAAVHISLGGYEAARQALDRVAEIAIGPEYESLQLRARFERARLAQAEGSFDDAEQLARKAVDDAVEKGMLTIAADGLRGLATAMMRGGRFADADVQFNRAIELAVQQKAKRTEMQARLQQASMRQSEKKPAEAIALAETPLVFFTEQKYQRNIVEAKNLLARSHEDLGHYADAQKLGTEALALADSLQDSVGGALALDNLAGVAAARGRLPEALAFRERLEKILRDKKDHVSLGFNLVNRAALLMQLGRGDEGEAALAEVENAIAAGQVAYAPRARVVALVRAERASIEGRFGVVEALARKAIDPDPKGRRGDTDLRATVLLEYARAQTGVSRTPVDVIAAWPSQGTTPLVGRELAYWVARTLLARRSLPLARQVAEDAWTASQTQDNLELRWRLGALAAQASAASDAAHASELRAAARKDLDALLGQWAGPGVVYGARPDLVAIRKGLS